MKPEANDAAKNRAVEQEPLQVGDTEQGLTTNIGFQNPNAPAEHMGLSPLPAAGGIGAQDPGGGGDLVGEDQVHELGIASYEHTPQQRRPDNAASEQDRSNSAEREAGSGGSATTW